MGLIGFGGGNAKGKSGVLVRRVMGIARRVLPRPLRKLVLRFGVSLGREDFPELAYRLANAPDAELAFKGLASRGFVPAIIVDAGAFEGQWALMVHAIWPGAEIVMVEANPAKLSLLEDVAGRIGGRVVAALLGATDDAQVSFHVMSTGSSVFEEQSGVGRTVAPMTTRRLDTLLAGQSADLLKIDVQGYEIEVLRGAGETLKNVKVLVLEVSLIDINAGAPLMHEVIADLAARNFVAYDIIEFHRRPLDGALWQVDVIFVPAGSPLRARKSFDGGGGSHDTR